VAGAGAREDTICAILCRIISRIELQAGDSLVIAWPALA